MEIGAGAITSMFLQSLICVLVTSVCFSEARHIEEQPTMAFWQESLPNVPMPVALQNLVSPLSSSSTRLYLARLKQGMLSTSNDQQFCTSAQIYCSSKKGPNPDTLVCVLQFEYSYGRRRCKSPRANNLSLSKASQVFFTSDTLKTGVSISYPDLTNNLTGQHFLPKALADALPFNIEGVSVIRTLLKMPDDLDSQEEMQETLQQCATPAAQGELKECQTSMESMVTFATHNLGSSVSVYTPRSWKASSKAKVKQVSEVSGVGKKVVSCHNLEFPYLVYSCHMSTTSRVVEVSLEEASKMNFKALAVCHSNTQAWSLEHVAFTVLKDVKPGDGKEVCHWIPQNHFVWTASTA